MQKKKERRKGIAVQNPFHQLQNTDNGISKFSFNY